MIKAPFEWWQYFGKGPNQKLLPFAITVTQENLDKINWTLQDALQYCLGSKHPMLVSMKASRIAGCWSSGTKKPTYIIEIDYEFESPLRDVKKLIDQAEQQEWKLLSGPGKLS